LKLWTELSHITDQRVLDAKVSEYNNKVKEVWDQLMGLEMQLVDQLEVGLVIPQNSERMNKRKRL
jgi:hypothetical protein